MILKSGDHWTPEDDQIIKWQQTYKNIDVYRELDAMDCWCEANPAKRKTKSGIARFINAWLSRADQQGGSPVLTAKPSNKIKQRDWDTIDHLTHDFMDNQRFRERMLQEHGRYMSANGERVYAK